MVPRMLVTGSWVAVSSAIRTGASCLGLLVERAPSLAKLAIQASAGTPEEGESQAAFRDELVALVRESAQVSWREQRRGADDFDARTRFDNAAEKVGRRPYRVKA